jgi:hypothetical protein
VRKLNKPEGIRTEVIFPALNLIGIFLTARQNNRKEPVKL